MTTSEGDAVISTLEEIATAASAPRSDHTQPTAGLKPPQLDFEALKVLTAEPFREQDALQALVGDALHD